MTQKVALITGITGQDGSYLAEFLLNKITLYMVLSVVQVLLIPAESTIYLGDRHDPNNKLTIHYGDLTDSTNLIRILQEVQPDEFTI